MSLHLLPDASDSDLARIRTAEALFGGEVHTLTLVVNLDKSDEAQERIRREMEGDPGSVPEERSGREPLDPDRPFGDEELAVATPKEIAERRLRLLFAMEPREREETLAALLWDVPAAQLRRRPAQVTFATGLPALDALLGGGVRTGSLTVIQGPPDSGKTTLALQLGLRCGEQGAHVAILAADSGQPVAASRLGEQLGLDASKLLQGEAEECDGLETELEARRVSVPDESEAFERTLATLKTRAPEGAPLVIVVDSLQRARFDKAEDGADEGVRFRLTSGLDSISRAVAEHPLLMILTSEVSRGAYASRDPEKRTEALAAGAETRAIEYRATVLLHLTGAEGRSTVELAKNKLTGRRGSFRLQLGGGAVFRELDEPEAAREREKARSRRETDRIGKLGEEAAELLRRHGPLTVNAIHERTGGRKPDLTAALAGLEAQGRARWRPGKNRSHTWELTASRDPQVVPAESEE